MPPLARSNYDLGRAAASHGVDPPACSLFRSCVLRRLVWCGARLFARLGGGLSLPFSTTPLAGLLLWPRSRAPYAGVEPSALRPPGVRVVTTLDGCKKKKGASPLPPQRAG